MRTRERRSIRFTVALFLLSGAGLIGATTLSGPQDAAPRPVVLYLEDGPWVVTPLERNGAAYLPLVELLRQLALPYTDATATGLLTIRGPSASLTLERESGNITLDGRPLELEQPVLNENGRWLAPVEFLIRGLSPATGIAFTATPARIIASNVDVTPLDMEAAAADGLTRLTIRLGRSSNVRVQQDRDRNLVILSIDRAPLLPRPEALTYRDSAIRSVAFDDSDGRSQIVVETTPQVANIRLVPGDENRTFFLELVPTAGPVETVAAAPAPGPAALASDAIEATAREPVRVLVLDPGHGGLDSGTRVHGVLEKDLTLVLALRLRATLQARLNATIILTREQDRALDIEDRSAIANQSRADLLISLHVGYSEDETESSGAVFVMKSPQSTSPGPRNAFFVPWYEAHLDSRDASLTFATTLRQRLSANVPEWPVAVREAPLAVLASVTSAAVVVELGNANNPADLARLATPTFQNRVIEAIVESVQAIGAGDPGDD